MACGPEQTKQVLQLSLVKRFTVVTCDGLQSLLRKTPALHTTSAAVATSTEHGHGCHKHGHLRAKFELSLRNRWHQHAAVHGYAQGRPPLLGLAGSAMLPLPGAVGVAWLSWPRSISKPDRQGATIRSPPHAPITVRPAMMNHSSTWRGAGLGSGLRRRAEGQGTRSRERQARAEAGAGAGYN